MYYILAHIFFYFGSRIIFRLKNIWFCIYNIKWKIKAQSIQAKWKKCNKMNEYVQPWGDKIFIFTILPDILMDNVTKYSLF